MIYTVTFNPAIDYVMRMEQVVPGEVNRTLSESIYCGGKGVNVSVMLKTLGVESTALGFVAGLTGEMLKSDLAAQGVNTDFIELPQGLTRINVKIKADTETDINGRGPHISGDDLEKLFSRLDLLQSGDYLCLSGSIPASLPEDVYEKICAHIDGRGINTVVDATGNLLINVLKYKPFLIKPNNFELEEIFGIKVKALSDVKNCAERLRSMGAQNVLVSLAKDGALLITANGESHFMSAPDGNVRNSVGAGDSLVAGFIAGYEKTRDAGYALRLGVACGSATAFSDGLADKAAVEDLFNAL